MALADSLPMVEGLADFVKANTDLDTTDKGEATDTQGVDPAQQQTQAPPEEDGQADAELSGILKAFTDPDGKIRTKDVLKSYKEIQGFTTRVSQENKEKTKAIEELQAKLSQLQEDAELRQYQASVPPQASNRSFEEMFIENPEQAITAKAMEIANTQRITEVLEEKRFENPEDFQERMAYIQMLTQQPQYNRLQYSPKGVQKLFEIADKTRAQMLTKKAHESLKALFGDDVDLDKLKALARKDGTQTTNNQSTTANPLHAYMPDSGTSYRTGQDVNMNVNDLERRKHEAIAAGDADTVAGAILKQALLK
jgi:hypothetical protein